MTEKQGWIFLRLPASQVQHPPWKRRHRQSFRPQLASLSKALQRDVSTRRRSRLAQHSVLAEAHGSLRDTLPIITGRCDNTSLDAHGGPFRLVVPGEKRPARWVRQVTSIDLLRAP